MNYVHDDNYIFNDHIEYWRCTGAYASVCETHPVGGFFEDPKEHLRELCSLIKILLLDDFSRPPKSRNYDPKHMSIQNLQIHHLQIATVYGFAILEGLLRRYLREIDTEGGKVKSHIPDGHPIRQLLGNNSVGILEGVRLWANTVAVESTCRTLGQIDRLCQLDLTDTNTPASARLEELFDLEENIRNEEDVVTRNGVISELHYKGRNPSQHREKILKGIVAPVVTLCCLLFWDGITPTQFSRMRNRIREFSHKGLAKLDKENEFIDYSRIYTPYSFYHQDLIPTILHWDDCGF